MNHTLILIGAGAFGTLIGWFVYYINRYRKGDVQFSDLTTLIGIIGGGSVLTLFDGGSSANAVPKQDLFGAYGLGLFFGFFAYFLVLIVLVRNSGNVFTWTWFLDGRRKNPQEDEGYAGGIATPNNPMFVPPLGERVARLEEQSRQGTGVTSSISHTEKEEQNH